MSIVLQRLSSDQNGTFGVIIKDGMPTFTTLELPWNGNEHDSSCIPAGVYKAVKVFSVKFQKYLFKLQNVPDRNDVEIHIGNTVKDTEGCILIGTQFSLTSFAIMNSKMAFDSFMLMMPVGGFNLVIKDIENV